MVVFNVAMTILGCPLIHNIQIQYVWIYLQFRLGTTDRQYGLLQYICVYY